MEKKEFEESPAGHLVKAEQGAWAFVPNPLPPELDYRAELVDLISDAEANLGALRGIGDRLPNPHILIMPYVRREAVLSSRIEGTQSTLSDLYLFEVAEAEASRHPDVQEVANYVSALTEGLDSLDQLLLSLRLVRQLHETLMTGVRGDEASPGAFRRHQNYIGARRTSIGNATYVPPPVPQMNDALSAWEKFLHMRKGVPVLVQCALVHYQFEAIHPFADGNGRVGRLLITLFLCERGRLGQPLLYLSAFFERYRDEYYRRLLAVSRDGDWVGWLEYFLRGVSSQSRSAVAHAAKILDLHQAYRDRLQATRVPGSTLAMLDWLFANPFVTAKSIAQACRTGVPTAQNNIDRFRGEGILTEITGKKRGRIYCAEELLRTLDEPPSEEPESHSA